MRCFLPLFATIAFLHSCGQEHKSAGGANLAPTTQPPQQQPVQQQQTTTNPPAQEQPGTAPAKAPLLSLAVNTPADIPVCNADNNRQLVYVLESKEFQTCQAGAWVKVEITAPEPAGPTDAAKYAALAGVQLGQSWLVLPADVRAYITASNTAEANSIVIKCLSRRPAQTTFTYYEYKSATAGTVAFNVWAGLVVDITRFPKGQPTSSELIATSDCATYFP